jgi:hypothetical protein
MQRGENLGLIAGYGKQAASTPQGRAFVGKKQQRRPNARPNSRPAPTAHHTRIGCSGRSVLVPRTAPHTTRQK